MSNVPRRLAWTLGGFAGLVHLVWAFLAAFGAAEPFVRWVAEPHFVSPDIQAIPFSIGTAALLVVVTSLVGALFGFVIGTIWEKTKDA